MKKFKGTKRLIDIQQQCEEQGVPVDKRLFVEGRSDYMVIGARDGGHVFFNTFNGTFFGTTPEGRGFDSIIEGPYENEPWFQALLSFFYVEHEETSHVDAYAKQAETLAPALAKLNEDLRKHIEQKHSDVSVQHPA